VVSCFGCAIVDVMTDLDIREEIARFDSEREETREFVAQQHKVFAEGLYTREPWMLLIGAIVAGASWRLPEILYTLRFQS
jgi:hypothetical protein